MQVQRWWRLEVWSGNAWRDPGDDETRKAACHISGGPVWMATTYPENRDEWAPVVAAALRPSSVVDAHVPLLHSPPPPSLPPRFLAIPPRSAIHIPFHSSPPREEPCSRFETHLSFFDRPVLCYSLNNVVSRIDTRIIVRSKHAYFSATRCDNCLLLFPLASIYSH